MSNTQLTKWLSTPIGIECKIYVDSGCYIFPLHGVKDGECTCGKETCGTDNNNAGKHPYTQNGLKDATTDIEQLAKLFNYREDLNVGLRTGEISGIWVLDVDSNKGGEVSLDKLEKENGKLPATLTAITGSGYHLYFNYPKDRKIKNSVRHLGDGLDTRGDGGYVVCAPSTHRNGSQYHFEENTTKTSDTPEWLLKALEPKPKPVMPVTSISSGEQKWDIKEVERMLEVLDPSMAYLDWLNIGMALNSGGFPLSMWDAWSKKSEKYQANDCAKRWGGFNPNGEITMGTLVDAAKIRGWRPEPIPRAPVDTSNVLPMVQNLTKKEPKVLVKPVHYKIGFDPMKLPGLIGDTVRWITNHAIYKQPELALLNTLAFAGAVFGRRYASPINTRTNLYIVGTGGTGSGKDMSRKAITQLAVASGLKDLIGANAIRSDGGLLQSLKSHTSQLMMLDEFGMMLQALSNPQSPHYMRAITKTLMGLYSDSNSIYNHGNYADAKIEPIVIHNPNLCIYGTTTEASYVPFLRKSAIESGELNRFVILPGTDKNDYPKREVPLFEVDESLRERWEIFSPKKSNDIGVLASSYNISPTPKIVSWGDCDDLRYKIQCKQTDKTNEDSPTRNLWSRMFENTVKIAMLFAIARNAKNPVMAKEDFDYAQSLVECSIYYLSDIAISSMAETPQESIHNEIIKEIKAQGNFVSRTELLRKFRKLKKRDLDDILNGMIEQEVIVAGVGTEAESVEKGRKKTIYSLAS